MSGRLFVYGTLRSDAPAGSPGAARARAQLARHAVLEGRGRVAGRLYDLGAYPGFVPGGRSEVAGEVWRVRDRRLLALLDAYEGPAYVRMPVRVRLGDGRRVTASLYRYRLALTGIPRIASGDYLEGVRSQS